MNIHEYFAILINLHYITSISFRLKLKDTMRWIYQRNAKSIARLLHLCAYSIIWSILLSKHKTATHVNRTTSLIPQSSKLSVRVGSFEVFTFPQAGSTNSWWVANVEVCSAFKNCSMWFRLFWNALVSLMMSRTSVGDTLPSSLFSSSSSLLVSLKEHLDG
jgi:hypothetical protein